MALRLVSLHQANHKGDNGDDSKYEEKDFGNFDRTGGNATKAQHCCDQCNHEKYDGIVKHVSSGKGAALVLRHSLMKHLL